MDKVRFPDKIHQDKINRIKALKGEPVISLYLPSLTDRDTHQEWHSLYSIEKNDTKESELTEERKKIILSLLRDLDSYFKEIEEVPYNSTSVLIISPNYFFEIRVPKIHEKLLVVSPKPYLKPLESDREKDLDLIICLDRGEAFLATSRNGKAQDFYGYIKTDVPKKVRAGNEMNRGLNEKRILHHIEWHLNEHFKKVLSETEKLLQKVDIRGIYLGGHKETINKFERKLPKSLRSKVKTHFLGEPDMFIKEFKKEGLKAVMNHRID